MEGKERAEKIYIEEWEKGQEKRKPEEEEEERKWNGWIYKEGASA